MKLFETVTPPSKRMDRQTTPSIAGQTSLYKSLSPQQEKSRIAIKNNSSIKPNKSHSKYVCFGRRKTREERKICLKIQLFSFPEALVMRHATTAARNVVTLPTLIGSFEFERQREQPLNLSARSNSNGQIRVKNETTLQAAVVACIITRVSGKPKR